MSFDKSGRMYPRHIVMVSLMLWSLTFASPPRWKSKINKIHQKTDLNDVKTDQISSNVLNKDALDNDWPKSRSQLVWPKSDFVGQKCSDYKTLNLALNGYNVINGNRMADGGDPGFGLQIFKIEENSCNNNFIQVDQTTYCNRIETTTRIENIFEYESKSSESASNTREIEGSFGVARFFLAKLKASYKQINAYSSSFEKEKNFFGSLEGKSFINSASCEVLKVTINTYVKPTFETGFINALSEVQKEALQKPFPTPNKRVKIKSFFQEYGTHFQKESYMGASFLAESRFFEASSKAEDVRDQTVCSQEAFDGSIGASGILGLFYAGAEGKFKYESQKCSSKYGNMSFFNENEFSAAKVVSHGSLPALTIDEWRKNISSAPLPLKFNLQPISNLFQQEWLNGISPVFLNATQLTEYFEDSLNVLYYCIIMIGENCILSCNTPGICGSDQTCSPMTPTKENPLGFKCSDTNDEIGADKKQWVGDINP